MKWPPPRFRLKLQPKNIDHLLNPAYRKADPFLAGRRPGPEHVRTGVWVED